MTVVSPYAGLEPVIWRILMLRGVVFRALRPELAAVSDHVVRRGPVQRALEDLADGVQACAPRDVDDAHTVTLVIEAWDDRLGERLAMLQIDDEDRALLAKIRILAQLTKASDPFGEIFGGVTALAHGLYGDHWRPATLDVLHIRQHPRSHGDPFADPYGLTATTLWPPQPDEALVELMIHADGFGPAAYAALPLLLVHECVCHVPARQDRASNESAFAEGLMDWTAYHFHDLWAVKLDLALAPAARKHAHCLRNVLTGGGHTAEARARLIGHEAAEHLQVWFEVHCDQPPAEACMTVARLAVQLNLVDRPLAEKDLFVSVIGPELPPQLDAALLAWEAEQIDTEELLGVVTGTGRTCAAAS